MQTPYLKQTQNAVHYVNNDTLVVDAVKFFAEVGWNSENIRFSPKLLDGINANMTHYFKKTTHSMTGKIICLGDDAVLFHICRYLDETEFLQNHKELDMQTLVRWIKLVSEACSSPWHQNSFSADCNILTYSRMVAFIGDWQSKEPEQFLYELLKHLKSILPEITSRDIVVALESIKFANQ